MRKLLYRILTSRVIRNIVNPGYKQLLKLEKGRIFIAVSHNCRLGDLTMFNHAALQLKPYYSLVYCCTERYFEKHRNFLQNHSLVTEVFLFPGNIWRNVRHIYRLIFRLRREKIDAVIVEEGAMIPAICFYLAGVPVICTLKGISGFATHYLDLEKSGIHYTQLGSCILGALSDRKPARDNTPFLHFSKTNIEEMHTEEGCILSMHIGGGAYWNRKWPFNHYRELCRLFLDTYKGKLVLVGGQDEYADNEQLKELLVAECNAGGRILNFCGSDLNIIANILSSSDVFIGNDSGPMHMATAVNTKVIAIFGPSWISRLNPTAYDSRNITIHSDLACVPCRAEACKLSPDKQYSCLADLPVATVWAKLREVLQ